MTLAGQLYAVEFFVGPTADESQTGFFVARNDVELVAEFDNSIKSIQFLGDATILGFYDDEIEEDTIHD